MLQIIGLILKIIGILLLAVLGLLLFMILIVLLVPIRYKMKAEHGEELIAVEGRANWLLHLVNVRFTYLENVFHIQARILWFTLYDNLKPKAPRKPKQDKKPKTVSRSARVKKSKAVKQTKADKRAEALKRFEAAKKSDAVLRQEVSKRPEISKKPEMSIKTEPSKNPETLVKEEPAKPVVNPEMDKYNPGHTAIPITGKEIGPQDQAAPEYQEEDIRLEAKEGFFDKISSRINKIIKIIIEKIKKLRDKIKTIAGKIKSFRENLIDRIKRLLTSAAEIKHKISLILDFIRDEYNRQGFKITYASLIKLLKHILPTKLKSRIVFGTGDPCSTGQALGAMSILYSFYGDKISIVPDFENKRFEGKHYARGRIRLVTILIIVIKLILDKRFKLLSKNFQILKEAL